MGTPSRTRAAANRRAAGTVGSRAKSTNARPHLTPVAEAAPATRVSPSAPVPPAPAALRRDAEQTERAFGRLNTDVVGAGRSAGRTVADAVEGAGDRLAGYHEQVAKAAPLPWVADLARVNAELTRTVTRAYAGTVRSLLKD